jgi:hypothetical protein
VSSRHLLPRLPATLAALALAVAAAPAAAITCSVPSAPYGTIASALADPTCTTVQVAAGTYVESLQATRDVTIQGAGSASTVVAGLLRASGPGVDVTLKSLRIDATASSATSCAPSALDVRLGAEVIPGPDLDVRGHGTPIANCVLASDGFESGNLAAWLATP